MHALKKMYVLQNPLRPQLLEQYLLLAGTMALALVLAWIRVSSKLPQLK